MRRLRLRLPARAASAVAAAAVTVASLADVAYADGHYRRPPPPPPDAMGDASAFDSDPDTLERMARALREMKNSPLHKHLNQLMKKQEATRLEALEAEQVQMAINQNLRDIERKKKEAEENRKNMEQQLQSKAQALRYEDDLARKRMQTEHEAQRRHDAELVKMQEASGIRKEEARRATEQKMLQKTLQAQIEKAERDRETNKAKAYAEGEARAHAKILSEDVDRDILVERMKGEREKWLAAVNTTFSHIEGFNALAIIDYYQVNLPVQLSFEMDPSFWFVLVGGFRDLFSDRKKLMMGIGGVTALAAGVYTTREGARVTWGYINRILGQPSLIRESSMPKFPLPASRLLKPSSASLSQGAGFENVILHPSLKRRIEHLARATANTKSHDAPFRNMMFYGPPGTGKTLVAREMARKSGLDYAMMTGGDVAPLGSEAVTKIHQIFDWAKKSKRGMLLFIDEADAFLCERNSIHMSEAQRSALNALLFRTGDQSRDIVLVLATNRPGDLDAAITDRIDEVIEFPLPGEDERFELLKLYLNQYILKEETKGSSWSSLFNKKPRKIDVKGVTDDLLWEAARKTDGFSGREIAKLVASVQAAVYGRPDCILDPQLFLEIIDYKVAEHHQRIKLASEGKATSPAALT
ncbi:hypothetical protein PR202_gb09510 [Eleusine coracana subsp. coracana]|uniref:AAA+ ATPase domain-containing protein n=1 Tax=Eleusine coracana subsp. coracana TaxID=191504 RepID=A0AAV5EI73_ELECO|nr:hypothetical protein PR202_gb09510 [Eleusine coracana subsp. coracana]